jgi:type II secretory pathway predicted ATPase ExeA
MRTHPCLKKKCKRKCAERVVIRTISGQPVALHVSEYLAWLLRQVRLKP